MIHRVRAIIKDNNKILVIKRIKKDSVYFVFPGGGVENDEGLERALKRECKEELGLEVKILKIFASERFDRGSIKQIEHFYMCEITSGELGTGDGPEYDAESDYEGVHSIEWMNANDISEYDLRPKSISFKLLNYLKNDREFDN